MKWNFLSGDSNWEECGGKFISPPQTNGEFTYWFILDILNWENVVGTQEASEIDGTHCVSLSVVAPSECPTNELKGALESCGCDNMEIDNPLVLVEVLHSYGIYAQVWSNNGKLRDLMKEGKKKAIETEFMFGFAMDRPQNAIGATGWDFLRGITMPDMQTV